tara:strand:- start:5118 stop:5579 length:462 start_codon:yes stop_codon:yes gene_type:complete
MALETKTIKIGEFDINIVQFNALESIALRCEVVEKIKELASDASSVNANNILKSITGLIYQVPGNLYMKLFKNCSAMEIGGLNNEDNFNKVFNDNLDGITELTLEILEFNGFFSLRFIEILKKKIPWISPIIESIQLSLEEMKKQMKESYLKN